jgi:lysyl-tRNA synthetase class 2
MPTEAQWSAARAHARLDAGLRAWFDRVGFLEIETPLMVPLPGSSPTSTPSRPARATCTRAPSTQ